MIRYCARATDVIKSVNNIKIIILLLLFFIVASFFFKTTVYLLNQRRYFVKINKTLITHSLLPYIPFKGYY